MADKMDRGLDEIIADTRGNDSRNRRGGGGGSGGGRRREQRQDYPRDGVRKVEHPPFDPQLLNPLSRLHDTSTILRHSYRDETRSIDSEWVHDRYEENNSRRAPAPRRRRDESPDQESRGTKVRVENIHYDLTEEDLEELFWRIGKVAKLQLRYDRAGRSEGTAFVTYERKADATEAIRQFDGANANGQPIRLSLVQSRNPFDTAVMPGKPLSERVSAPGRRARSFSPHRRYDKDDTGRKGIDRYIPEGGSRSRSPMPRQRGGRRPGARREGGGRGQDSGREGTRGNPRSKKTQEELDAEMEDYFGGSGAAPAAAAATTDAPEPAATAAPAAQADDIDMIE